jgi:hypothetical protein
MCDLGGYIGLGLMAGQACEAIRLDGLAECLRPDQRPIINQALSRLAPGQHFAFYVA